MTPFSRPILGVHSRTAAEYAVEYRKRSQSFKYHKIIKRNFFSSLQPHTIYPSLFDAVHLKIDAKPTECGEDERPATRALSILLDTPLIGNGQMGFHRALMLLERFRGDAVEH